MIIITHNPHTNFVHVRFTHQQNTHSSQSNHHINITLNLFFTHKLNTNNNKISHLIQLVFDNNKNTIQKTNKFSTNISLNKFIYLNTYIINPLHDKKIHNQIMLFTLYNTNQQNIYHIPKTICLIYIHLHIIHHNIKWETSLKKHHTKQHLHYNQ